MLPKKSEERIVRLEVLNNEGNFKHNLNVLKDKKGFLVVGRRENPENNYCPSAFLPCEFCRKFILKKTLWIHHRNCKVKRFFVKDNQTSRDGKASANPLRHSRLLLSSALMSDSDRFVRKLLTRMQDGQLKEIVENDELIRKYAALRVEALGSDADQKTNGIHRVSQRCRTLARLVQQCKVQNTASILNMDSLLTPDHFDLVVSSTKALAIDRKDHVVSLGRHMENIIGHMIETKKGDALRKNDDKRCQQADNFQKLFHAEWNCRVNSVCTKRNNTLQGQKIKPISFTEDVKNLKDHIITCMRNTSRSLKKNGSEKDWMRLSKLTLCRLILFNKRRPAEVKEMKVDDFFGRQKWNEQQKGEFPMALSESDKLLAERMDMVLSAGKSRKNVDAYVLLPPDAKQAIELLIERRQKFTQPSNKHIFSRSHSDTPLTGDTDLKEIVAECPHLKYPEKISSTSLRKYIATVSQILDMTDAELEMLANHLCLDVKTNKENYRLSHSTRELTVVSQLLVAVENGYVNTFKGRQLSSISVNEVDVYAGDDLCPLENDMGEYDKPADLDANPGTVEVNTASVEGTTVSVEGNDGSVEGNDGSVEGKDGSVEGNDGSVKWNAASVEGNDGSDEGNDGSVKWNAASVEGNDGSDEGNDGSVEGNAASVEGNNGSVKWNSVEGNNGSVEGNDGSDEGNDGSREGNTGSVERNLDSAEVVSVTDSEDEVEGITETVNKEPHKDPDLGKEDEVGDFTETVNKEPHKDPDLGKEDEVEGLTETVNKEPHKDPDLGKEDEVGDFTETVNKEPHKDPDLGKEDEVQGLTETVNKEPHKDPDLGKEDEVGDFTETVNKEPHKDPDLGKEDEVEGLTETVNKEPHKDPDPGKEDEVGDFTETVNKEPHNDPDLGKEDEVEGLTETVNKEPHNDPDPGKEDEVEGLTETVNKEPHKDPDPGKEDEVGDFTETVNKEPHNDPDLGKEDEVEGLTETVNKEPHKDPVPGKEYEVEGLTETVNKEPHKDPDLGKEDEVEGLTETVNKEPHNDRDPGKEDKVEGLTETVNKEPHNDRDPGKEDEVEGLKKTVKEPHNDRDPGKEDKVEGLTETVNKEPHNDSDPECGKDEDEVMDYEDSDRDPDFELEEDRDSDEVSDSNRSDVNEVGDYSKPISQSTASTCKRKNASPSVKLKLQLQPNMKGKRKWDKIHFCFFCGGRSTNLTKHLFGPHKNETEVARILAYPKASKERKFALMRLRNAGDYKHNMEVLRNGQGTLVTWSRKAANSADVSDYLPCEDCLGFFLHNNLWRHKKECPFSTTTKNNSLQAKAALLLPTSVKTSKGLNDDVLPRMTNDPVGQAARNDQIIVKIGEKHFQKNGRHPRMVQHISQKMRRLGRFLMKARELDDTVVSLSDVIVPEKFPLIIRCVQNLCGHHANTHHLEKPVLAYNLGHLLRKCARIKKSQCLVSNDSKGASVASDFETLVQEDWTQGIASSALHTQEVHVPARGRGKLTRGKDIPARGKDKLTRGKDIPARGKDIPARGKDEPPQREDKPACDRNTATKGKRKNPGTTDRSRDVEPSRKRSKILSQRKGKIQRLTTEQSSLLRNVFQVNIDLHRELRKADCDLVLKKYPILASLSWEKIKNTIHNWITAEKRRIRK